MLRFRVALLCLESIARCVPVNRGRLKSLRPSRFAISRDFASRTTSQLKNISMSISTSPSSVAAPELTDQRQEVELLPAVNDHYGGVIVEMKTPMDSSAFASSLKASISNWRKQGIKAVWIKLPINLANLVQPAVEVLVVQENSGKLHGSGVWKFPTGVVDQGEDIYAAAIREAKEETGIDTEFVEILAFRQNHRSFFGKSDLFFVCMLRPLSFDIQKQESEIEAAQWMPVEEYAAQPFVQKYDVLKYIVDVCLAKVERSYAGFSPVCVQSPFSDAQDYLYLNCKDLSQPSRPGNMSESN